MCSAVAVRNDSPECGVVTFFKRRHNFASITETAAPVSMSATVATPSTATSITLDGEKLGLRLFDDDAVLASGTAASSFPRRWRQDGGA